MLPLNLDVLLTGMATQPNFGVFIDTLGMVDAQGRASSAIDIPPGLLVSSLIGLQMDLAHVLIDGTGYVVEVSNVATVSIGI